VAGFSGQALSKATKAIRAAPQLGGVVSRHRGSGVQSERVRIAWPRLAGVRPGLARGPISARTTPRLRERRP